MKHSISSIGKSMLQFQENLAKERRYKPVQPDLFLGDVRDKYRASLPSWCVLGGAETSLETTEGTFLCSGYRRIVIGDYGAFVEIAPSQINTEVLRCQPGEEYRYTDERFAKNCKYLWLTTKDLSYCKIYHQKKTVEYADYLPDMYYVSPYEVFPVEEN